MTQTLYLRADLAGRDIVIPAINVESVVNVTETIAVPCVAPHICGLFALRSRVLTLIDCQYFITGKHGEIATDQKAIVVIVDGHSYGLIVDEVQDIFQSDIQPTKLPSDLGAGWNNIGNSILHIGDESLLIVEPDNMIVTVRQLAA